jgi:hypothetical protein
MLAGNSMLGLLPLNILAGATSKIRTCQRTGEN